ncbi:MAG: heat-inducible transcriptional repressor HrcA [Acidimicrobiia bacterium]
MDAVDRRAAVLRAIVEEYVQTAQPVASQSIAQSRSLGVSSATVRNDMTQLEREGYIVQPHTSAGRIPTDQGYRYFVDHFTKAGTLPVSQRRAVADFFASAHSALEDLLHETSQLLARLTSHAAVVVGPQFDAARVRSAQLVGLQPELVLAIAVLSNGSIEKEVISNAGDYDEAQIARASAALDATLHDQSLGSAAVAAPTGDRVVDELVRLGIEALARRAISGAEPLYGGGASRIVGDQDAFATAERASRLLEMLEEQVVVVSLVRDLLDQGLTVSIGSENDMDELRDCSLVLAPYSVDGQMAGTVGVLGPTRMDYQQALAAVAAVSQQLGRLLLG